MSFLGRQLTVNISNCFELYVYKYNAHFPTISWNLYPERKKVALTDTGAQRLLQHPAGSASQVQYCTRSNCERTMNVNFGCDVLYY
jgi:hypothetical protein